jgi:UDP-N-acetyl-D-mannosaminuronic acid dehydrogenase
MKHDVCVIGLGYIGLPTASVFAGKGLRVLGVDTNPSVVSTLGRGEVHFVEPGLEAVVREVVNLGYLHVSSRPAPARAFIVAVPTPFHHESKGDPSPDISFVEAATRSLGGVAEAGDLVILESTSPVGTTERMREWLDDEMRCLGRNIGGAEVLFAHCPERVLPGQILKELAANDRIVGGLTEAASERARLLYGTFCTGEILLTDARTAEMAKLTENSFRDVNIAFANELSVICERLGIDVWNLIRLANRHPRVKILSPGPGVGGHCIAVDPWFIVDSAPDLARLIRIAREVNDAKPGHVVSSVKAAAAEQRTPVIACLGLAFKANVDDLRESPAVEIVRRLATADVAPLLVVEPYVSALPKVLSALGTRVRLTSLADAVSCASIVVVLVDHREFLGLDRTQLQGKVVIDTRGILRAR